MGLGRDPHWGRASHLLFATHYHGTVDKHDTSYCQVAPSHGMSIVDVIDNAGLHDWYKARTGLALAPSYDHLRPQQGEALEWALSRPEPYLFINAPTGAGKTLINLLYGALAGESWSYAVHTIRLQAQVQRDVGGLTSLTGRANHPCLIGRETHGFDIDAGRAICTVGEWCEHSGRNGDEGQHPSGIQCAYYSQLDAALDARYRITNYAMLLSMPPLTGWDGKHNRPRSEVLLADEAHNIEEAVAGHASLTLTARTLEQYGEEMPAYGPDLQAWAQWAARVLRALPSPTAVRGTGRRPDFGLKSLRNTLDTLANLGPRDVGVWLVTTNAGRYASTVFEPIWGSQFVMGQLFGHRPQGRLEDYLTQEYKGVRKVMFTSATLMGPEFIADTLGLPRGSWAYLDLPSTFDPSHRPINYCPVDTMNREKVGSPAGRATMQVAIDKLIEHYYNLGQCVGIVHAVSNAYRDAILTESRWKGMMTTDPAVHELRVNANRPSVLVAANLSEGYDGRDGLCRFIVMPKVPFPSLGDRRTAVRREEDPRSYDHRTLVAVVQGAGRGVRHREDYADTWLLDGAWRIPFNNRREWLPDSFMDAYHSGVALPE